MGAESSAVLMTSAYNWILGKEAHVDQTQLVMGIASHPI
jgi:hypothetical protein